MKKLYLSFSFLLITLSVYSQNIYQVGSRVGISTTNPVSVLSVGTVNQALQSFATIFSAGTFNALCNSVGAYIYPFEFQSYNTANIDRLQIARYLRVAGIEWDGTAYRKYSCFK